MLRNNSDMPKTLKNKMVSGNPRPYSTTAAAAAAAAASTTINTTLLLPLVLPQQQKIIRKLEQNSQKSDR